MVTPTTRKAAARHLVDCYQVSERSACQLVGISRTEYRYQALDKQDDALRARLQELATQQSAYGYLLLHALLKAEGLVINRK
ncbi:Mobile element protein [Halomonas citrativorans]|uniref:Mobile element protein n=1 Tax=Halomonas citrativorans TaxID=2742612 RepID=A0A1R4I4S5_9GAMM|nr:Mobile element protein [Halomonas citrativorans]